jgi:hypothetical protein
MDWIHLAQDTEKWQNFVNRVMSIINLTISSYLKLTQLIFIKYIITRKMFRFAVTVSLSHTNKQTNKNKSTNQTTN